MARTKHHAVKRGLAPREVADKSNWPTDVYTRERRPPSPRTLMGDIDYSRLVEILRIYPTQKAAAAALGVSDRTIRRYIHDGIPPTAHVSRRKLAAAHTGAKRRLDNAELAGKPIVKRELAIHRKLQGTQTDTYFIEGMSDFDVIALLYRACLSGKYITYSMTLKFDMGGHSELVGYFEAETGQFIAADSKEWKETRKGMTRMERAKMSMVTILENHPFVSTRPVSIKFGRICHPDEYAEQVTNAFHRPYMRPVYIVFYRPRPRMQDGYDDSND